MLKLEIDGVIHECPDGIDVNVWDSTIYGGPPFKGMVISVYRMERTPDGLLTTDSLNGPLVSIDTDLPMEEWGEDEWYGFDADTAPGDFPGEVLRFILPFIEKV